MNTRKTVAVKGLNRVVILEGSPPRSRVRVDTMLSLAVKPVMRAVEARQSPKPRGLKMGDIRLPSRASRLTSGVAATFRRMSKVCSTQMMTEAAKIMVKAFCTKPLAFSQISWPTLLALGSR